MKNGVVSTAASYVGDLEIKSQPERRAVRRFINPLEATVRIILAAKNRQGKICESARR
jgi:hypothetical protein